MTKPDATVYKYLSQDGCRKTLSNGTLRFSRPSTLNDPFDVYLDDLFNVEIDEVLDMQEGTLLEALENDPERFAALTGTEIERAKTASQMLRSIPNQELRFIGSTLKLYRDQNPKLRKIVEEMKSQRDDVIEQFQHAAIFCATKSRDNLLMWAHYADQHRGAVLGFRPDVENDSMLRMFEHVRYTNVRPSFYEMTEPQGVDRPETLNLAYEVNRTMMLTKSSHWEYENEVRIFIPNRIPADQEAIYLAFRPHELTEIVLGCRADAEFAREAKFMARGLNPNISVLRAMPKSRSFELSFERDD